MQLKEAKAILKNLESSTSIDDFVASIRALREARERFDGAMMMAIRVVEHNHMELLRNNGCDTIERFIRSYELCSSARYRSYCNGLELIGEELAFEIGAEATIEAARIASADARADFVEAAQAWSSEHGGVTPSCMTAEKIRLQVAPEKRVPGAIKRLSENAQLKQRICELETENKMLKAKVHRLEKELLAHKHERGATLS